MSGGTAMTYLLALLAAIVGGAIGAGLGMATAAVLAPILGISSFEGASGYFAVFIGGPIGGLLGLVLGAVLVLRKRGHQGFGAIAGRLGLVAVGVALIAAAGIGVLYLSQDMVNPNGAAPQLAFEIRLPAGAASPGANESPIELQTGKNRMPALIQREATRDDGGRPVLVGLVEMYYRSSQRMLVMTMPDKTDVLFSIKLAAAPKHSPEFSAWQRADYIGEPGKPQARRATAADDYEIRYRADWADEN
ncbi:MAG TPA: hypothetical protein VFK79_04820 [Xanthobacteraceae bacterium]|nr:hypothetical protein [Xanthobacteraceae bacterium]